MLKVNTSISDERPLLICDNLRVCTTNTLLIKHGGFLDNRHALTVWICHAVEYSTLDVKRTNKPNVCPFVNSANKTDWKPCKLPFIYKATKKLLCPDMAEMVLKMTLIST